MCGICYRTKSFTYRFLKLVPRRASPPRARCPGRFTAPQEGSVSAATVYTRLTDAPQDRYTGPSICIKAWAYPFQLCAAAARGDAPGRDQQCKENACTGAPCPSRFDVTLICNFRPRVLASNERTNHPAVPWASVKVSMRHGFITVLACLTEGETGAFGVEKAIFTGGFLPSGCNLSDYKIVNKRRIFQVT